MDLIILGVVAVFLVFRLFSMIGQDLGGNMDAFKGTSEAVDDIGKKSKAKPKKSKPELVVDVEPKKTTKKQSSAIDKLMSQYPEFNPQNFINGAGICFKNTVENFASGNKDALKELLTPATYKIFAKVIDDRNKAFETAKDEVVGIIEIEIVSAKTTAKSIDVEVKIVSDQINAVFDGNDRVIEGHPNDIVRITDNWVFTRDKKSTELNWYVKETS